MSNADLIKKFELFCESQGLTPKRVLKYRYILKKLSKWLRKDFTETNADDIVKLLAKIEKSGYTAHTRHDYKVAVKKFYRWLGKEDLINWIKTTIKKNELPPPEIITRGEVLKMVQACRTVRDKALISVLFESGARIGELLSLTLRDVEFDSYGAVLMVRGKTGSRRIRICGKAVDYLKEWIYINHPDKMPDSRVFPFSYKALEKALKNVAKRAGLNKDVHFHMFRHGRATELAAKLNEMELDIFMGWELSSKMPRVYCHLSGKDIEKKILQISGATKDQQIEQALSKLQIKKPELFKALFEFVKSELRES